MFVTTTPIWFEGVVEDRVNDPLKLFRVKVRIIGLYTSNKSQIPTEDLHWAQVMHPTTSAAISGVGSSPAFVEGTHVIGYFRDGENCQDPIVIGTVGGVPDTPANPQQGFNDPNGVYPKYINESDTSRLARNENTDKTVLKNKKDSIIKDKKLPAGGKLSQPNNPYNASYPYNKVIETESGHVVELDDTEGSERVCITHKSGSFIEMHPDGTVTIKSVTDRFEVVTSNDNKIVGDSQAVHVTSNAKMYIGGDYDVEVNGTYTVKVNGDYHTEVAGDTTHDTAGDNIQQASNIYLN